ncbi:MAG: hypothetical protein ACMXX6_00350 [Candidatus Woesearchaeota archaeon]
MFITTNIIIRLLILSHTILLFEKVKYINDELGFIIIKFILTLFGGFNLKKVFILMLFVVGLLLPALHAQAFNITHINDASNSLEIRYIVENNISSNLSLVDYKNLTDQRKNAVAQDLFDNRPYSNLTHFSDIFSRLTNVRYKIQIAFDAANSSSLETSDFSS